MFCDLLTDDEFIETFETGAIPNHEFRHIDHIRMAYLYLKRNEFDSAAEKIVTGIKTFAAIHQLAKLYHHTITWFWIYAVYAAMREFDEYGFREFLERNPALGDKDYILEFFSKPLLMSDASRASWVMPDKKWLPIFQSAG
jgi:hypothetical protein